MEEKILSKEEVSEVVKNDLGDDARVVSYGLRSASEDLMGFLGEHYILEAEAAVGGAARKESYFLKRMPMKAPQHREYAVKTRAFYKEIEMYKTVFADLKNAQRDVKNATKWCPRFLYSKGSELLVLEDLMRQGYYMYPERRFMDDDHLKASLRALAAMHAASLIFEEKYNGGKVGTLSPKHLGGKATLGEVYSHLTFETEASDEKGHPGNTFHEVGISSQVAIVELLSGYSQQQKEIIRQKLPSVLRHALQLVKTSDRFKNVFLHGDLWANNLLFRKDETGKVENALIIDFQLARYAPPAHDVMMFLHFVQSKKFLKENEHRLLDYYYAAFDEELRKNSLSAEVLLPRQTFLDSCEFYDDLGLIMKLFYFQLILAPPEIVKKFQSSPELFMKYMLIDRTEMVVECFQNNDVCRERMTEAMVDVIDRFIIPSDPQRKPKPLIK